MKAFLSFIGCMFCTCLLLAQESAVPKNVTRAFKHQFNSAESQTWYVEPKHYEVQFLEGHREKIAFYAKSDGQLMQTKVLIEEKEIPNEVMQAIRLQYPDFVLDEYSCIVRPDDTSFFSISLKTQAGVYNLELSAQGEVLTKVKVH